VPSPHTATIWPGRDDTHAGPYTKGDVVVNVRKAISIASVARRRGWRYLAFEIDPDVAQTARDRVRDMQPPLFVPEPEQAALWAEAAT